jgi:hypothetical protein
VTVRKRKTGLLSGKLKLKMIGDRNEVRVNLVEQVFKLNERSFHCHEKKERRREGAVFILIFELGRWCVWCFEWLLRA